MLLLLLLLLRLLLLLLLLPPLRLFPLYLYMSARPASKGVAPVRRRALRALWVPRYNLSAMRGWRGRAVGSMVAGRPLYSLHCGYATAIKVLWPIKSLHKQARYSAVGSTEQLP